MSVILIKNGTIVTPQGSFSGDIRIEGEKIREVIRRDGGPGAEDSGSKSSAAACGTAEMAAEPVLLHEEETGGEVRIIDAAGKLIFPGFIDAHTHFDLHVAGTVTCDDFYSGTRAAVAGGTTTVIDFGTQYPGETLTQGLKNWLDKAREGVFCDYGIHMTITDWNEEARRQCRDMMDLGATTFKVYMTYDTQVDDRTLFEILLRLKEVGGITGCHCENSGMIDALRAAFAGEGLYASGLPGAAQCGSEPAANTKIPCIPADAKMRVSSHYKTRPAAAEAEAIGRLLHLAEMADAPVIDVHLTCEEGLEEIRQARRRGQTVIAETCPQYLTMDDSLYELPGFEGAKYVCAPPLRKKSDCEALWKALAAGEIQTVSTDHCAFTFAQKKLGESDFRKIPGGMPGAETRGIVIYSEGVAAGRISKEKMCEVLSEAPARIYGLYPRKGVIAPGADADLVILDPAGCTEITAETQVSRCDYAPLEGRKLAGHIEQVYLRGQLAADAQGIYSENRGMYLARKKSEIMDPQA